MSSIGSNGSHGFFEDFEYWSAYFATTIGDILSRPSGVARERLRAALERFRRSEACTAELGQIIDGLTDDAAVDSGINYKPCANPECRAPIPRRSPKLYCDSLCRKIASEYAAEERKERAKDDPPPYGDIPF